MLRTELGMGSKLPKQVSALVTYLGRQLKYKAVCNWHSQTQLAMMQTVTTFLEGHLSVGTESLTTACVLGSSGLTHLLYRSNAIYNNENCKYLKCQIRGDWLLRFGTLQTLKAKCSKYSEQFVKMHKINVKKIRIKKTTFSSSAKG